MYRMLKGSIAIYTVVYLDLLSYLFHACIYLLHIVIPYFESSWEILILMKLSDPIVSWDQSSSFLMSSLSFSSYW